MPALFGKQVHRLNRASSHQAEENRKLTTDEVSRRGGGKSEAYRAARAKEWSAGGAGWAGRGRRREGGGGRRESKGEGRRRNGGRLPLLPGRPLMDPRNDRGWGIRGRTKETDYNESDCYYRNCYKRKSKLRNVKKININMTINKNKILKYEL